MTASICASFRAPRRLIQTTTKPILFFEYSLPHIEAVGDRPIRIFDELRDLGYERLAFYDNFGGYLLSCLIDQTSVIEDLRGYLGKNARIFDFDIVAFYGSG